VGVTAADASGFGGIAILVTASVTRGFPRGSAIGAVFGFPSGEGDGL